jgi:hypothetical protein
MKFAIVDLDGTVADCTWRLIYAEAARAHTDRELRNRAWRTFHSKCTEDPVHEGVADLVRAWARAGNGVIYLTGRGIEWANDTVAWLRKRDLPIIPDLLLMRGDGDWRNSVEYKRDMYERMIASPVWKRNGHTVSFVLEDMDKLVEMWRGLGLTCLQPARNQS